MGGKKVRGGDLTWDEQTDGMEGTTITSPRYYLKMTMMRSVQYGNSLKLSQIP